MSQEIHYLETGSQDPFYNLAFEETRSTLYCTFLHIMLYYMYERKSNTL